MLHRTALFVLAACLMSASAAARQDDAGTSARSVIESGRERMLAALRDPQMPGLEKAQRVSRIAEERIDFEVMSRLALGPAFAELTEPQQAQFATEFRKHVLAVIIRSTERYSGQEAAIAGDRTETRGDHVITTRITSKKTGVEKELAKVDFRLRQRDGRWGVIDLSIQGISLAGGFRVQFAAIMKDGGPEKLLQLLREKNAAHETASAERAGRAASPH